MCNILKMADRRAKRMKIWDLQSHVLCYVGFSYLILLSSVEVIRCILQNSLCLNFKKKAAFNAAPTIFIQFQPNFRESM